MTLTGMVNAANARIDLFVDWTSVAGTQLTGSLFRRVGGPSAELEYVRGLFGTSLLGEQFYVSDHEAPFDQQIWYYATNGQTADTLTAGPFTIPSNGYVWMKDPGRPWADLRLDLCNTPSNADPAACVVTEIVSDTFSRTVASGWGSADTGQAWTNVGGTAADFNVGSGTGTHTHPAVNTVHRSVITATTADQDVKTDLSVSQLALTDSLFSGPVVRHTDASNFYWARVTFTAAGTVQLTIRKRLAGVETTVGSTVTLPFGYVADQVFTARVQIIGPVIRAKVWPASVPETETWTVSVSDTSHTTAAQVGLRSLESSTATNVSPVFRFDNFAYLDPTVEVADPLAWVGFRDKVRSSDAGLFPVLNAERPADVYARRKDITTGALFLSRSLDAITLVYELFTAGGPVLIQVPDVYGMASPYGITDRYYQPDALTEEYLSSDQRKPLRLWTVPLTSVDLPVGEPQGTDTANWCAVRDTYATFADLTATGYTWGQAATGAASSAPTSGLYGGGLYGSGFYGG